MVALHLPQPDPHDWSTEPRPGPRRSPVAVPALDRATIYRRRRLAVLVLAALLVLGVVGAGQYLSSLGGGGATAPIDAGPREPAGAAVEVPGDVYVVQPGDTLWSIANSVAPDADPRATVDRLRAANGDGTLEPGQRLVLDLD